MILVINLGLKSIRAIIFDEAGQSQGAVSQPVNTRLSDNSVEQNAFEWQEKMGQVVRDLIDKLNAADKITQVTVSCSASCLVPVDADLIPLARVVMVSDKRAADEAKTIAALPGFDEFSMKRGYSVSQYSQLSRVLWFKNNAPDVYEKTHKFLAPNDYLLALLSGGMCITDTLNAEKFFFDHDTGAYPENVLDALELDAACLPDCVPIGTDLGVMPDAVASDLGITSKPRIVVSTYDAICSVFGTGASDAGQVCDVSGTVTSVRMYSQAAFYDPQKRIACQYFPPSNGYLLGGSNNLGGGLIEWAKQCLYADDAHPYENIQAESAKVDVGSGLIFLPNLLGTRAPSWNATTRGVFFGLERHHTREHMMRAVIESIAFSVREFMDIFRETEVLPQMVTASGGLARLPITNELKATITGLPYHLMDEFESTCLGAAIIVMCASGAFSSYNDASTEIVRTRQIFLPQQRHKAYYDDMYGLYQDLFQTVDPLFEKRASLLKTHGHTSTEYVENL